MPIDLPRAPWYLGLICLLLLQGTSAGAQTDDVSAAANAFGQAQRAELSGDSARAAELYELADSIAPAPEALRNAARAWLAANRLVPAATNAEELLRRYGSDPTSRQLAEEILGRARPQLGRFQVDCTSPCVLSVNGLAVGTQARTSHTVYLQPGPHTISASFEGGEGSRARVESHAGESGKLELTRLATSAPASPAAPEPAAEAPALGVATPTAAPVDQAPEHKGLHQAYFWSFLGATVAVGAVTIWSGVDLLNARDDFKNSPMPTQKAFDSGENKDLRTTILIVGSSALAATTVVLGLFTDFGKHSGRAQARRSRIPALGFNTDGRTSQLTWRKAF
ncbi:MAG: hypothetical protein QM778_26940 [Myxococcales bacterium]